MAVVVVYPEAIIQGWLQCIQLRLFSDKMYMVLLFVHLDMVFYVMLIQVRL